MEPQKKHFLNVKLSVIVYNIICNIPVCFFLCLTSTITNNSNLLDGVFTIDFNNWNWLSFGVNFAVAFVLAMCIGCFIPLTKIGRWFTGLFHVENVTYTGNMKYRLLATIISSCIFYIIISPSLTVMNYFLFNPNNIPFSSYLIRLAIDAPIMLLVGFVSSLISDLGAYKAAHSIDENF